MTVAELIALLQTFPADMRVAVYEDESDSLLPIRIVHLPATTKISKPSEGSRDVDFVVISSVQTGGSEGDGPHGGLR